MRKKEIKTRKELLEKLNNVDKKCIDEGLTFYDLKTLFEAVEHRLSAQDRADIKRVASVEEDPETLKAYIDAKVMEEDFDEDGFRDWVEKEYYPGFDLQGISDDEYYALEDAYRSTLKESKDNSDDIVYWVEKAEDYINNKIRKFDKTLYIDDVKWGRNSFEIPIYKASEIRRPFGDEIEAVFNCSFKDEEDFYGSKEEQLKNKLDNFFYDWNDSEDDWDYYSDDEDWDDPVYESLSEGISTKDMKTLKDIIQSFGIKIYHTEEEFEGLVTITIDANGYKEVEEELNRDVFNHGFDIIDVNVGPLSTFTNRETTSITFIKDENEEFNEEVAPKTIIANKPNTLKDYNSYKRKNGLRHWFDNCVTH